MSGDLESFHRFCPQCDQLTVHTGYIEHWSRCDTCGAQYFVVPSGDYYVRIHEVLDSVVSMETG